jgi:hypothetical protein
MLIGRVGILTFFASVAFAATEPPDRGNATRDIII